MDLLGAYIPLDRRQAMARGNVVPNRMNGAILVADISGFTPLTEALMQTLGPKRGAGELTKQLNLIYEALIAEVHHYQGSVIDFSGDAITCWFDASPLSTTTVTDRAGLRATACAMAMQQAMDRFTTVQIPSGPTVSLAIKAAIAFGPVRRFLVGDPHIQLIDVLAGNTLDRAFEAESQAEKGEVLIDSVVAGRIGSWVKISEWRKNAKTNQRFAVVDGLESSVPVDEGSIQPSFPRLKEEQKRPWLLPPVYQRLRTGGGRFLTEYRRAVALFLKFGGLNYDQDEAAGEKLDRYIQWVQNILAHYGGYLIQMTTGDKGNYLYAAFGAPLVHDDNPAQAVAAALALHSLPPELAFISSTQIGISQGRMWTGAYGSSTRHTYGVMSNETNVAARLMEQAQPGQILISQRIADAVAQHYQCRYLGPITIKGKLDPLPIFLVLDKHPTAWQGTAPQFPTPLIGRNDELTQIEQILEPVPAGQGQILRLEGVAGIGKSRLAVALADRARRSGLRVVWGTCQSISQDIPYYPWRQVFRALFAVTDERLVGEDHEAMIDRQVTHVKELVNQTNSDWNSLLPLLGDLLNLPIPVPIDRTTSPFEPHVRQGTLIALVMEVVQIWAQAHPLVMLIDDAQWMDEASSGLTRALGRIIGNLPVLLVLVHRPPASGDGQELIIPDLDQLPYYRHLRLGELSSSGIAELVTNRLQGQVTPLALTLIQARADNNPFFTEELIDTLRGTGRLYRQIDSTWTLSESLFNALREAHCLARQPPGHEWALVTNAPLTAVDLGVPDSIQGLVQLRLDRLSEAHKMTLKVASVIGRTFEFEVLAQAHPDHPSNLTLQKQLAELETEDLIHPETPSRWVFAIKHHITQEVIYATLPESQQCELHLAVGNALEHLVPEAVERLAHHFVQAGEVKKAFRYLIRAGDKARGLYAYQAANDYYDRAAACLELLPEADQVVAKVRYEESVWGLQRAVGPQGLEKTKRS